MVKTFLNQLTFKEILRKGSPFSLSYRLARPNFLRAGNDELKTEYNEFNYISLILKLVQNAVSWARTPVVSIFLSDDCLFLNGVVNATVLKIHPHCPNNGNHIGPMIRKMRRHVCIKN